MSVFSKKMPTECVWTFRYKYARIVIYEKKVVSCYPRQSIIQNISDIESAPQQNNRDKPKISFVQ